MAQPQNNKLKAKKRKQAAQQKEIDARQNTALANNIVQAFKLHQLGNHKEAITICNEALSANPDFPEAYSLLGIIQHDDGNFEEAITNHKKSIQLDPKSANYFSNLGASLNKSGNPEEAVEAYKKAVEINPKTEEIYFNMAIALRTLGRLEEAIECYEKVLSINPDHASANYNLGNVLEASGKTEQALSYQERAANIDPKHAKARYNKSLLNLRLGNLKEGFKDYELRWLQDDAHEFPEKLKGMPAWDGSDLGGGTLLVIGEQGIGDIIQFIRYLPIIKKEKDVGTIILKCQPDLYPLFKDIEFIDHLVEENAELPMFDTFTSLLSLPYLTGTELETIPDTTPYLCAPQEKVKQWQKKITKGNLKIGIVWAGAAGHKNDKNRSCVLAQFETLMDLPETQFYSLQKNQDEKITLRATVLHSNFTDLGKDIVDFADTAAILEHLDLLISVDTSPVHLAGAMEKPVWNLLPFVADWRWLQDRKDSPWYNSMRLFRQKEVGNWNSVFLDVRNSLIKLLDEKGVTDIPTQQEEANPKLFEALKFFQQKDFEQAETICQEIIKDEPDNADAFGILGVIFFSQKNYGQGNEMFAKATSLKPDNGDHLFNYGQCLEKEEKFEEALEAFVTSGKLKSQVKTFLKAGEIAYKLNNYKIAYDQFTKALELDEDNPSALFVLGHINFLKGKFDEAMKHFDKGLEIDPGNKNIIYHSCYIHLLNGNYKDGLAGYETRINQELLPSLPEFVDGKSQWDCSNFNGKTVLIHAEQGYGDMIQCIRYAPLIKAKGGKIVAECHQKLVPLLRQITDIDEWLEHGKKIPPFDYHAPIMSLPYIFGTTVETIPNDVPYIKASEEKIQEWAKYFDNDSLKIGFSWSGNTDHYNNKIRSTSPEKFEELFDIEGIHFYSMQKIAGEEEAKTLENRYDNVTEIGSKLKDFRDSAAVVHHLDMVISVDTAIVHLAGAMAKPLWVLLAYVPDWRWMLEREDSPWYPTAKLFRQQEEGDWDRLFINLKQALEDRVGSAQAKKEIEFKKEESMTDDSEIVQKAFGEFVSGNIAGAEETCRKAIDDNSQNPEIYNLLSGILQKQDLQEDSIPFIKKATELDPSNPNLLENLYGTYRKLDKFEEALEAAELLIKIDENNAKYNFFAGSCLFNLDRQEQALEFAKKSLELDSGYYDAILLSANIEQKLKHIDEALKYYDQARQIHPDDEDLEYNHSLALLLKGDFKEGFKSYEKRWRSLNYLDLPSVVKDKPLWNGEDIKGKTIFFHTEQGFGDALQFIRYLPEMKKYTDKILVGCRNELLDIIKPILPEATWVPDKTSVPPFDYHCPVMSLARIFGTTVETIPDNVPYIHATEEKISKWKPELNPETFNIGLVWSGNPRFPENEMRSCPLSEYEIFMDIPGITFYSLQKGSQEKEISELSSRRDNVIDLGNKVEDFADTAAILSQLDLFISTDTSVPHLAGAMGVRTWLLAAFIPDWRWLLDRSDCPWYPSMKLFRQPEPDDWKTPVTQIYEELKNEIKS